MTDDEREIARLRKNEKQRERYANDPEYRERMLAADRARGTTEEGRAKRLARKKRWQAANRAGDIALFGAATVYLQEAQRATT